MQLTAPEPSSFERTLAPEGLHPAWCVQVIHIGTGPGYKDEIKNRIELTFELPLVTHTFKPEKGPEPLFVSKEYPFTFNEKSGLRKDFTSWKGSRTDEQFKGLNILTETLGFAAMVNVVHHVSESGKKREKITAITGIPQGYPIPTAVNPLNAWSFETPDFNFFNSLNEYKRKQIMNTDQWRKANFPPHLYKPLEYTVQGGQAVAQQPAQGYYQQPVNQQPGLNQPLAQQLAQAWTPPQQQPQTWIPPVQQPQQQWAQPVQQPQAQPQAWAPPVQPAAQPQAWTPPAQQWTPPLAQAAPVNQAPQQQAPPQGWVPPNQPVQQQAPPVQFNPVPGDVDDGPGLPF